MTPLTLHPERCAAVRALLRASGDTPCAMPKSLSMSGETQRASQPEHGHGKTRRLLFDVPGSGRRFVRAVCNAQVRPVASVIAAALAAVAVAVWL